MACQRGFFRANCSGRFLPVRFYVEPALRDLDHFRHNLRTLIEASGTIAEACRELDLNRQQMAKYLSGESLPSVPLLVKICDHFGVSTDIAHRPLIEVTMRDDDQLFDILRIFSRGSFKPEQAQKRLAHPFTDGYYMQWQPSVWRTNMVVRQLTQIKTVGNYQYVRQCAAVKNAMGFTPQSRKYSLSLALGDNMQFMILTFFRRKGANTWGITMFRESGYRSAPHFTGIGVGAANQDNADRLTAMRLVLEKLDMTGKSLLSLARQSAVLRAADVPSHVLRHLRFENGEFQDIITPF